MCPLSWVCLQKLFPQFVRFVGKAWHLKEKYNDDNSLKCLYLPLLSLSTTYDFSPTSFVSSLVVLNSILDLHVAYIYPFPWILNQIKLCVGTRDKDGHEKPPNKRLSRGLAQLFKVHVYTSLDFNNTKKNRMGNPCFFLSSSVVVTRFLCVYNMEHKSKKEEPSSC